MGEIIESVNLRGKVVLGLQIISALVYAVYLPLFGGSELELQDSISISPLHDSKTVRIAQGVYI